MDQNSTQTENNKNTIWWRESVLFFARVSGFIAFPIIISVFLGKFLDKYFNTGRLFFFLLMAISFVTSLFFIVKESKKAISKIENETKINSDIK